MIIVKMDQANKSVNIQLDGNITGLPRARLNVLNIYNLTSGVTAQIHNILDGTIDISFDGENIQGAIDLGGCSGFQGPLSPRYTGAHSVVPADRALTKAFAAEANNCP